ncbi:MAG: segregation/condensation protein A [Angelakisella sp.]|jgi:segregation and condensation protein A|nr:segregation/condensation protein A [Angelakisella sp.]
MEEPQQLSFRVSEEYEGPLDLILALISKHKLNIWEIEISSLLEQYMAYIRARQEQDLEVASEFLEMASRLVYIKTVSLLPKYEEEKEKAKAELVGQLLEYQACKAAAALLGDRAGDGFGTFIREPEDIPMDRTYQLQHPPSLLAKSYWEAMGRGKRRLPPQSEVFSPLVAAPVVSVSSRILHILRRLYKQAAINLPGLFLQSRSRSEAVATFMAVLELMKARRIRLADGDSTILFLGKDRGEKGGKRHAAQ